mgnify:CR=1 FL=1
MTKQKTILIAIISAALLLTALLLAAPISNGIRQKQKYAEFDSHVERGSKAFLEQDYSAAYDAFMDAYDSLPADAAAETEDELAKKGIELYDIKFEFGKIGDEVYLIDEISGGNMRAFKDGKHIMPLDLCRMVLDE